MKTLAGFVVLLLLSGSPSQAELVVEILGMPTEVYSFEPIYVLYSVENRGPTPVLLPNGGFPRQGVLIYFAPKGERPRYVTHFFPLRVFRYASESIWLAPGERWLFFSDFSLEVMALEGELDVQAVMSGDGHCGGRQDGGRTSFSYRPHYLKTLSTGNARMKVYRCWEGEVRSGIRSLRIRQPMSPVDQAARMHLLRKRDLIHNHDRTEWAIRVPGDLAEKFPRSHYSYATLTRDPSQISSLQRAMEMQPQNPLNSWVMGAFARRVLDYRSSCWNGQKLNFDLEIEKLELPPGVEEYLDQYAWFLEHRHCPLEVEKLKQGKR